MGMFDTIIGELECPRCKKIKEREIQIHCGPSNLDIYYIGDTIEPFYFGDYWFEEEWSCDDCNKADKDKDDNAVINWHKAYIHCMNGMILEISNIMTEEEIFPDWALIHKVSRERHNYRSTLIKIDNMIKGFAQRKDGEKHPLPYFRPKNTDELLEWIKEGIAEVFKGNPPGLF